jgi:hypothetical protein
MVTIVSLKKKLFGNLHNFNLILVELGEVPVLHLKICFVVERMNLKISKK